MFRSGGFREDRMHSVAVPFSFRKSSLVTAVNIPLLATLGGIAHGGSRDIAAPAGPSAPVEVTGLDHIIEL